MKSFKNEFFISIIVCTYNRAILLQKCLSKLEKSTAKYKNIEVLIIDNNSSDITESLTQNFCAKNINWKYFFEPNQGLSYARNKGVKSAIGEWLFFVDDDGVLHDNAIDQVIFTIDNYPFIFFTGVVKSIQDELTPKWFPYEWGNTLLKGDSSVRPLGDDHIAGGVMVINRSVFYDIGLFDTNIGMIGNKIGYGEESQLEEKAKKVNIPIGINPKLILFHPVAKHKRSLNWILKASFAKGRDGAIVHSKTERDLPIIFIHLFIRIIKNFVKSSTKLIMSSNYYWQNFIIDNLSPFLSYIGLITAIVKNSISKLKNTND